MTRLLSALTLACLLWPLTGASRELPPAPGTPKPFELPEKDTVTLDNGLRLTFLEYGSVPLVTLQAVIRTGAIDDDGQTWIDDLVADMLKEGTTHRSAEAIAREAADMGGSVSTGSGAEQSVVDVSVLSENAVEAAALLADVLRNPAFPASELPRLVANYERNLSVARRQPGSLAAEAMAKMVYGTHPFGRSFPEDGQLASYTIDDLQAFYEAQYGAARTHVFVAGRFDRPALQAALIEALADWRTGSAPTDLPPSVSETRQLEFVARPAAPQSSLRMAVRGPSPGHPDWIAASVMNSLLGGSFASRITTNIREDKGYTYSPNSSFQAFRESGLWLMSADVTTEHTADSLREIYSEIDRLQREAPSTEELDAIKNYRAGIFVVQNSSPDGVLRQLAFMDLHGLPDSYLADLVRETYAVTPQQVSEMAARWIAPERMSVVVVGDLEQVEASVRDLPQLK